MKISVITPNYNGAKYLEECIRSVISQRQVGVDLEYIVVDGGSTDGSLDIIRNYETEITSVISEPDRGPTDAINKGLRLVTGDIVGWLNADDCYYPAALERVLSVMTDNPYKALCFGHCPIVDEKGNEIRARITRFKEFFFPISCRFTIQCINYISQPAMFFRRSAYKKAGPLREDLAAAFDYDFVLRLWRQGGAACIPNPPLAAFRWHEGSISGQKFRVQFKEEWHAAARSAGAASPQALIHLGVRWGIVWIYSMMAARRERGRAGADRR
jgi:glycosyltransferase involved in cell wall biosynthesis